MRNSDSPSKRSLGTFDAIVCTILAILTTLCVKTTMVKLLANSSPVTFTGKFDYLQSPCHTVVFFYVSVLANSTVLRLLANSIACKFSAAINFTWIPLLWLIYLLTCSDTERACAWYIADDSLVLIWYKHGFHRELITKFLNKGWGLRRLNKLLKNRRETGTTAIIYMKRQHWKHRESLLFFYSVIFTHKLDIIRKEYVIWL